MGQSRYTGEMGRTRTGETTVWCPGCGAWFGARWFRGVDAAADPGLVETLASEGFAGLNESDCPACERPYVVEEPVVVHREGALVLVMPLGRLHRAQQARGALIAAVADAPGAAPPDYAREPVLVAGSAGLAALLAREAGGEGSSVGASVVDEALGEGASEGGSERGSERRSEGSSAPPDAGRDAAGADEVEVTRVSSPPLPEPPKPAEIFEPTPTASTPPAGSGLLAALIDDAPASEAGEAGDGGWDEAAEADPDWGGGWSLSAPVEHEPTRVAPRPRGLRPGIDRLLLVEGEAVTARLRVAATEAAGLLVDGAALRFQLHETPTGPASCLTLVPAEGEPVVWPIDDDEVRGQLTRRFMVVVELYDEAGELIGEQHFGPPLARNVAVATARGAALGGETDAAREAVMGGEVDLLGELRHNFTEDSFSALHTVADAHLALGIVGFWSMTDRLRYLLLVQSFPAVWFDAIVRRVLRAALGFGLLPPPHLERWAIEHGLASDAVRLLRRALAGFAELSLGLAGRSNVLDPLDTWENWERLLTRADELGVDVGPDVEALARRAMKAAQVAAGVEDASDEAIELDIEDAIELESVDLSIDESSDGAAPEALDAELADRGDAVLLGLLDDRERRATAARVLLQRGDAIYAPALADAILALSVEELRAVLPAARSLAASLTPHLREAAEAIEPERRALLLAFVDESDRGEGPA